MILRGSSSMARGEIHTKSEMIPRHTPLVIQLHAPILLQTPLQPVHPSLFRLPLTLALGGSISSTIPSTCPHLRFSPPSFRRGRGRTSRAGSPRGSTASRVGRFILGVCNPSATSTTILWTVHAIAGAMSVTSPFARRTSFSPNHGRDLICGGLGTCGWWAVGSGGGVIALASSSGGRSRHGRLALWQ